MIEPCSVFIPLAGPKGMGRIAHIVAKTSTGSQEATGFDPAIAALADVELHDAGQVALDAVRLVAKPTQHSFRLTKLNPPMPELLCANRLDLGGLTSKNSASSELGLALGLLTVAHHGRAKVFFATGMLHGAAQGAGSVFGQVLPVEGVEEKLEACAHWLETHIGHPWGTEIQFYTPRTDTSGQPFENAYAEALQMLVKRARSVGVEIKHRPVANLSEALPFLNLRPVAFNDRREMVARIGLASSVAAFVGAAALFAWFALPPVLKFQNTESDYLFGTAHPLAMQINPVSGEAKERPACLDQKLRPRFSTDEAIMLRATTVAPVTGPLSAYHPLVIIAGESSGPRAFSSDFFQGQGDFGRDQDGRLILSSTHFLAPPGETMRAMILLRRLIGFDLDEIQRALIQIELETDSGQSRLDAVTAYISELRFTSKIATEFRVLDMPDACTNHESTICAWQFAGQQDGAVKNGDSIQMPPNGIMDLHYTGQAKNAETLVLRGDAYLQYLPGQTALQDQDRLVLIESGFVNNDREIAELVTNPFGESRGTGPTLESKLGDFQICVLRITL